MYTLGDYVIGQLTLFTYHGALTNHDSSLLFPPYNVLYELSGVASTFMSNVLILGSVITLALCVLILLIFSDG